MPPFRSPEPCRDPGPPRSIVVKTGPKGRREVSSTSGVSRSGDRVDQHPGRRPRYFQALRYGQYRFHMGNVNPADLATLGRASADGVLNLSIARTVSLEDAIPALPELEEMGTPKGGKLLTVP